MMNTKKMIWIACACLALAACGKDEKEPEQDPTPQEETPQDSADDDQTKALTVTDCQGNVYPVVQIGEQYWMAENLRCTQYDTESERAGATLAVTAAGGQYDPYYVDARKGSNDGYEANLTAEHYAKLGLLYNWAAAMGYASEAKVTEQTGDYDGDRQGICPNGWHVPSRAEWTALLDYVASQHADSEKDAGHWLKSQSGWYGESGADAYGFNLLPAGYGDGSEVRYTGCYGEFATSGASDGTLVYDLYLDTDENQVLQGEVTYKFYASSVRCIRD